MARCDTVTDRLVMGSTEFLASLNIRTPPFGKERAQVTSSLERTSFWGYAQRRQPVLAVGSATTSADRGDVRMRDTLSPAPKGAGSSSTLGDVAGCD
jgi:hypothetical protein